jgi:hypothetical protein
MVIVNRRLSAGQVQRAGSSTAYWLWLRFMLNYPGWQFESYIFSQCCRNEGLCVCEHSVNRSSECCGPSYWRGLLLSCSNLCCMLLLAVCLGCWLSGFGCIVVQHHKHLLLSVCPAKRCGARTYREKQHFQIRLPSPIADTEHCTSCILDSTEAFKAAHTP